MLLYLLGYKFLDFTNDHGEVVKGLQAFTAFQEDGVTGQRTDKLFFKDGFDLPELTPGMALEVTFNRKGKPEKVTVAPAAQKLNLGKQ